MRVGGSAAAFGGSDARCLGLLVLIAAVCRAVAVVVVVLAMVLLIVNYEDRQMSLTDAAVDRAAIWPRVGGRPQLPGARRVRRLTHRPRSRY